MFAGILSLHDMKRIYQYSASDIYIVKFIGSLCQSPVKSLCCSIAPAVVKPHPVFNKRCSLISRDKFFRIILFETHVRLLHKRLIVK